MRSLYGSHFSEDNGLNLSFPLFSISYGKIMSGSNFIIKNYQNDIGYITLNRGQKANAYSSTMLQAFEAALDDMERRAAIRVIVIRAQGRSFCAGADLDELRRRSAEDALNLQSAKVFTRLAHCPRPTIAMVQGPAVAGGFELALSCDFRFATPAARFSLPEVGLGILPAAGGIERLTRLVGGARARMCVLAGRPISAQEALDWGLVTEICSHETFDDTVVRFAHRLAACNPMALRLAKEAIVLAECGTDPRHATLVSQALLYHLA